MKYDGVSLKQFLLNFLTMLRIYLRIMVVSSRNMKSMLKRIYIPKSYTRLIYSIDQNSLKKIHVFSLLEELVSELWMGQFDNTQGTFSSRFPLQIGYAVFGY
jgi:hypothetical protein